MRLMKEGCLLVGTHILGGRVFPRISSISKISIDPGPEGVFKLPPEVQLHCEGDASVCGKVQEGKGLRVRVCEG